MAMDAARQDQNRALLDKPAVAPGVMIVLCDASTQLLGNDVEFDVARRLAMPNDGEVVKCL